MTFTALLMALNVAAADLPRSRLVDEGHVHQWSQIVDEDDTSISLDLAHSGTHLDEGRPYPTVLIRGIQKARLPDFSDYLLAIDCDGSRAASLEGWIVTEGNEGGVREKAPQQRFRSLTGMPAELRDTMFSHICGPTWSYESSK
ncbi:hypothetical protein [Erythrobacter crassostreae]|uniref:Uncharacterized protein n=1 Tax=Erythrobacter crassostreae TaxID=2828328 RepID=A0A9X1F1Y5_9SPHN|nr:hypothetical protein [Erythrobacter crassostrea]MBV7258064.1 hypothetical protein [Erythrobacter crassostrea]